MDGTQLSRTKAIHRRTGRTFYYATRLFPERVRHPTYALYGFFRIADEVVDGADPGPPAEQRQRLDMLREQACGRAHSNDQVVQAFDEVRAEHGIPTAEVEAFIDAMQADIHHEHYETFEDLREYMRGSAAAVGRMMCALMDPDEPGRAHPHAGVLGEAFQLTNFIRDVNEDLTDLDRVYLPTEIFERHGIDPTTLAPGNPSPGFREAIRTVLRRAEALYHEGVAGIRYLPHDCQLPVLLAAVLYAEHHRLIRRQDYDVLSERPSLSTPRKLYVVARTIWAWRRLSDPVTAFEQVSAVRDQSMGAGEVIQEEPLVRTEQPAGSPSIGSN